jgi:hypothetical protein
MLARVESVDSDEPALNAPAWTASAGVSSPLLGGVAHVSSDVAIIGSRHTRDPERDADPYAGWNLAVYAPDLRGVDITIQVRNLLGAREEVPTQEDYDRTDPDELLVPVLPGQGRELHASIGIRY